METGGEKGNGVICVLTRRAQSSYGYWVGGGVGLGALPCSFYVHRQYRNRSSFKAIQLTIFLFHSIRILPDRTFVEIVFNCIKNADIHS